jgi:hypothetical protein
MMKRFSERQEAIRAELIAQIGGLELPKGPGIWSLRIPCTWYPVPGDRYQSSGTRYLVPAMWYQVPVGW